MPNTNTTQKPHYQRVLLKLSGEALMGEDAFGINRQTLLSIVQEIKSIVDLGVEVGIVIGGGNIFRGISVGAEGMNRAQADAMGMLATLMNSLALEDAMQKVGIKVEVQSALPIAQIASSYSRKKAVQLLESGTTVIFGAGTGNPFFTTDTAAALRGIEIEANLILKATKVDGVYNKDPSAHDDAVKYDQLTFDQVLDEKLGVMDLTAICLCRDHNVPLQVFDMNKAGALLSVVMGEKEGTQVTNACT